MKRIYKYHLEVTDRQPIVLPSGSEILSVLVQYGRIALYALVDTDEQATEKYLIRMYGTGHPVDEIDCKFDFLGTVSLMDGQAIFHIFIRRDP